MNKTSSTKEVIVNHLRGGFAPLVELMNEFHADKADIVLPGLHFSAYTLVLHMQHRQKVLLEAMEKNNKLDLWPDAVWPSVEIEIGPQDWIDAVGQFQETLNRFIEVFLELCNSSSATTTDFAKECAIIALHHNSYHIGQLKAVGRQLGVW